MGDCSEVAPCREYGKRLQAIRKAARRTVRDAASNAGVDKNTILRLEAGWPVRAATRKRICDAYGVLDLDPSEYRPGPSNHVAVHTAGDERWVRTRLVDPHEPSVLAYHEEMQIPEERRRQGIYGLANQFFARLGCARPEGVLKSALLEVYQSSGYSRQPSGEGLIYVLSGSLRFWIGGEILDVQEGSALCFDRTVLHMHEPTPGTKPRDLPVRILYVQAD